MLCTLCPRECGVDRSKSLGYCGAPQSIKVARAALHHWEEPCISGTRGSGTVFFSGCQLKCCFCQNHAISAENFGQEISVARLSDIFLSLQEQGAHNINLVSPTPYVPDIIHALDRVRSRLHIPVVYNSGGYESVTTIERLTGYIDIYLPDIKYHDDARALRYSHAKDYFPVTMAAVRAMYHSVGPLQYDENGLLQKGMIIRHLVMPGGREDSCAVMQAIAALPFAHDILVSVMRQFTPDYRCDDFPEINRRLTSLEYDRMIDTMVKLGLTNGYSQEKSSAKKEYTPPFDLEGV